MVAFNQLHATGKASKGSMNRGRSDDRKLLIGGVRHESGRVVSVLPSSVSPRDLYNKKANSDTARRPSPTTTKAISREPFTLQRVSLDHAVSPLRARPTAPFAKSERKRAYAAASYYSECFLRGIPPADAEIAAIDAQNRYDKWWVQSKFRSITSGGSGAGGEETNGSHGEGSPRKKRKLQGQRPTQVPSPQVVHRHDVDPVVSDEGEEAAGHLLDTAIREISALTSRYSAAEINRRKEALISGLKATGGDVTTPEFLSSLEVLHAYYASRGWDTRWSGGGRTGAPFMCMDGTWLTLSKPSYTECSGRNGRGEYVYTLGRMSFDMFRPTKLVCSVQGVFNTISLPNDNQGRDEAKRPRTFPSRFQSLMRRKPGTPVVRNYDIVVAFTVDANQTRRGTPANEQAVVGKDTAAARSGEYVVRRPIHGLLTNHGYCVPDPDVPNRLSIWFSGGSLEVQNEEADLEEWKLLFDDRAAPRRDVAEFARVLAAKILLGACLQEGMTPDGALSYTLKRPIGGHGKVFCDVLYADKTLRVLRGHHDSIFVLSQVPSVPNDDDE